MAPRVEPRNTCRFLKKHAPVARLGGDQLTDLPLPHKRGRMGARRGVGEEDLHIARAHLAAVDAINRARLPLDAPRDLKLVAVVEGCGRLARAIVEDERHLGHVALGTIAGAGKNHVVHACAAHALGRILAHHPAQRLHKIGFAATIGPHNAVLTRLDVELRRVDEGFEAGQAKARNFQAFFVLQFTCWGVAVGASPGNSLERIASSLSKSMTPECFSPLMKNVGVLEMPNLLEASS